jgi:hypothetical protein
MPMATAWRDRRFLGIVAFLAGVWGGAIEVFGGRYELQGLLIAAILLVLGTYMIATGRKM